MNGDNRIRETIEVLYNESNTIYSIDKLQILMYIMDKEYYKEYNRQITSCCWVRKHVQPRSFRIRGILEDLPNQDNTNYYINEKEYNIIKEVINKYDNKSLDELRNICRNDDYYNNTIKHSVISFNNKNN